MSTMYCECEVNSVTKDAKGIKFSLVPVGTFRLSFRHDDKRVEYAVFSSNKELSTSDKIADAKLLPLEEGKLKAKFLNAGKDVIASSMLIAAAVAKSKILIGVADLTATSIKVTTVELR